MSSLFNQGSMTLPPNPFDSRQRAYKRKAYGSVTWVGNDQFDCGKDFPLTFGGDTDKKYSQGGALQPRSGGRYHPNAHLTSITTKNQGSGDISDTALWEVEFQYTCYSNSQLNSCADAFMIPGNLINVVIGYSPGDKLTIEKARVYDFSWSYNGDDGTYSCTCKCLGSNSKSAIAGATKVVPSATGAEIKDADGNAVLGHSVVKKLQNELYAEFKLVEDEDGNLTSPQIPSADGVALGRGDFGLIKGQKDASGWSMFWSGGGADNIIVPCVKLSKVVKFFNEQGSGVKYNMEAKYNTANLSKLKSADPMMFCFPGSRGNYGTRNNFSGLGPDSNLAGDIFISIQHLMATEAKIMESKQENNQGYTINEFLNSIFSALTSATGGAVELFITENDNEFYILNRKFDVQSSSKGTIIKLLDPDSPVKSLSMSSNLDPDMAAIAFAGGGGPYPDALIKNVFAGCTPKEQPEGAPEKLQSPEEKLQGVFEDIGENYSDELAQDARSLLKQYVNRNLKGISMRYGIDLNLTLDGWNGPNFMERFEVSPLPNAVSGGKIYYVVGEIEHKCDGMTWDTSIVGYMMVNAT